jgi:vanillate O-demethylase monooxygenase subunit
MTTIETDLWPALRHYWHAVAQESTIKDVPVAVQVLGERLVLVRFSDEIVCYRDLCIHRGTPLSIGWVEGDELVCAYHGWRYNAEGACTKIPALSVERSIPLKARVQRYRSQVRYGLVWVSLEEPTNEIPEFPEFDDPEFEMTYYPPTAWECSAARHTENTVDAAHFAWVHEGILGDRAHPEVPIFDINRHGNELRYQFDDKPNPMHPIPHRRSYRLHRPFTIHQRKERAGDHDVEVSFSTVCPIGPRTSVGFLIVARNWELTPEEAKLHWDLDNKIFEQDRAIVEKQRPEELPVDLAAELHIKGPDAVAVEYRRLMGELGINVDAAV